MTEWLASNPWIFAVILLIVGPLIAFFGKRWFPYIGAIIAAIAVMDGIALLAGYMGWLSTSWSPYVILAVAIMIGLCVAGIVVKAIWILVGIAGITAGFFFGLFIFGLMAASTNHAEHWELIALGIVFAIVGGILSFKWGRQIVVISTSFFGSYLFMRGWTFIFTGYPSESELWSNIKHGQNLGIDSTFWIFVAVWLVSFIISATVQFKVMEEHDDLKEHYSKVR